jgi:hypothetical protein
MFTAIIPTMWKSPRITQLITDLCASEHIGDVIVIDNNTNQSRFIPESSKISVHLMFENIYVNPSWNYGEDLLIANGDDWLAQHATPFVLHGLAVQSEISTTSQLEEFGMIQLNDNENYKTKYGTQRTN